MIIVFKSRLNKSVRTKTDYESRIVHLFVAAAVTIAVAAVFIAAIVVALVVVIDALQVSA